MQDDGRAISLIPREVEHAKNNRSFASIIVHSVKVDCKHKPKVSGCKLGSVYPSVRHQQWNAQATRIRPDAALTTIVRGL